VPAHQIVNRRASSTDADTACRQANDRGRHLDSNTGDRPWHSASSEGATDVPSLRAESAKPASFVALVRCGELETLRATLCYVEEITHRQMRNDSADVLRRVAAGESILVTNNGQPAAVIGPPPGDVLSLLAANGQLRPALDPPTRLRSIRRRVAKMTTADIISDSRGPW
jgi:prevent-host-death family protein